MLPGITLTTDAVIPAYEMLSNLVGLADLYRLTGEGQYLKVCTKGHYSIVFDKMSDLQPTNKK